MNRDITMPVLSSDMEEGTIVAWHKSVGEPVKIGEELVAIETGKSTVIYESPVAGILAEIVVSPQSAVRVGAVIARVSDPHET